MLFFIFIPSSVLDEGREGGRESFRNSSRSLRDDAEPEPFRHEQAVGAGRIQGILGILGLRKGDDLREQHGQWSVCASLTW